MDVVKGRIEEKKFGRVPCRGIPEVSDRWPLNKASFPSHALPWFHACSRGLQLRAPRRSTGGLVDVRGMPKSLAPACISQALLRRVNTG